MEEIVKSNDSRNGIEKDFFFEGKVCEFLSQ